MPVHTRIAASLLLLCAICSTAAACDAPAGASASMGASASLMLHVTLTKSPLDRYVRDSAAVQRLYTAAMALHVAKWGVYNCPADDGRIYHLSFIGGAVVQRQMTADAAGCPFLFIGQGAQARWMDAAFISLFMHTVGVSSLDPYLGNG